MRHSLQVGLSFGLTSAIITTLGLMVGLNSGTHSKLAVLGGIMTIAVADAFSDAMGIHVSEESENKHSTREVWESTIATFFSKLFFALTFIVPVLIFENLFTAVVVSIIWGLLLLSIVSFRMAKKQNIKPWRVVTEHLVIALIVVAATNYTGELIATLFG
ncbi:MAG TPA: hypothetical protein ENL13_05440 [Thermoplasmatales archaeon]|nr:hypothetical protein [Thermoplasmatales archaeon]